VVLEYTRATIHGIIGWVRMEMVLSGQSDYTTMDTGAEDKFIPNRKK